MGENFLLETLSLRHLHVETSPYRALQTTTLDWETCQGRDITGESLTELEKDTAIKPKHFSPQHPQ